MASTRWWSKNTVAVVTGSNQGIGYEIVRGLAAQGITTILTARNEERGSVAYDALRSDGLESVVFHSLDVTIPESIEKFATWLENTYGGLDILVNNAAIYVMGTPNVSDNEVAKQTLDTNYFGVQRVTDRLFPLLRPSPHGARIINVSSRLGQFTRVCHTLNFDFKNTKEGEQLKDVENLTMEKLSSLVGQWLENSKTSPRKWDSKDHFPYSESKLFLNLYSRIFSRTLLNRPEGQDIYLNCMCPGYTSTNLNNFSGVLTTREGADTAVWLALLPKEDLSQCNFFAERKVVDW